MPSWSSAVPGAVVPGSWVPGLTLSAAQTLEAHPMSDIAVENLEKMVNPRRFIDGSERVVLELPSLCVGRGVYQPGWRWSEHAGPQTGENSVRHVGLIESGRMTIRAADRTEATVGPGDIFEVGPGHDAWVIGNEPCVALDFEPRPRVD